MVEICHGAPFDEDYYIFDGKDALRALDTSERRCASSGTPTASDLPDRRTGVGGFRAGGGNRLPLVLRDGIRYAVNPGSVGQPRDGDARAAFAIYAPDTLTLELRRIDYAIDAAQRRIIVAGLPASLANRLAVGR